MKNPIALLITCAVIAGCASPEQLRQQAMNTSDPDLCYYAAAGDANVRQAAYYAIQQRGVNCNAYAAIVAARIQQNNNNAQLGLQLIQAGRPQPAPQTPQALNANCRSYNRGTYIQTVCD